MNIGLAIIVGKETEQLKKMLASVKLADFSCISAVMTKESLETETILKENGCKITKLEEFWKDDYSNWDFAKARQLSYDNCDSDYIFYMDTDDTLVNPEKLHEMVEELKDYDAIFLKYNYEVGNTYYKERIIKKGKMHWEHLVHECLIGDKDAKGIQSDKVMVQHHMEKNDRQKRNLKIMEREYNENKNARAVLYCGIDSTLANKNAKALRYLEEFLAREDATDMDKYRALMFLITIAKKTDDAEEISHRASQQIGLDPQLCFGYYNKAYAHYFMGEYKECVILTKQGFEKQEPMFIPHNELDVKLYPMHIFESALANLGKFNDCANIIEAVLTSYPNDEWFLKREKEVFEVLGKQSWKQEK